MSDDDELMRDLIEVQRLAAVAHKCVGPEWFVLDITDERLQELKGEGTSEYDSKRFGDSVIFLRCDAGYSFEDVLEHLVGGNDDE